MSANIQDLIKALGISIREAQSQSFILCKLYFLIPVNPA